MYISLRGEKSSIKEPLKNLKRIVESRNFTWGGEYRKRGGGRSTNGNEGGEDRIPPAKGENPFIKTLFSAGKYALVPPQNLPLFLLN